MYVGVIPMATCLMYLPFSIPHVCGGDPYKPQYVALPRIVFPMYVGVIPGVAGVSMVQ